MTSSKMGLFSLIDPPSPDHEAVVREAYKTTDFPWHRIIPRMRRWPHESIKVVWQPSISSGAIGTYANGVITLSNQFGLSGQDFTFVHECGHMIDSLSFTYEVQQELMAFWHGFKGQFTGQQMNGGMHPWSHDQPHSENWVSNNDYLFRHNEALADAFVAAFNPHIWGGRGPWGRFVHWPTDYTLDPPISNYDKIRQIILKEPIMAFTDVPEDHPHREGIEWAAGQGIVKGQPDGRFEPEKAPNRGQLCTMFMRALKDK